MCSVPAAAPSNPPVDAACAPSSPPSPSSLSFSKDGRTISVGDSALFQAGNFPPFIGIIRSLSSNKEDCLRLGVNWLYRPADIKLNKGSLLEAAPNEVFYSFHKDEIPAASLLHPCKVAFLRKGIELPSSISSFVCRRVYDIQNKCLWWLTDQDYINERQEEVDKLLDKTRLEMHAAMQSGARSPKPLNGPTSSQQLKPGSDSVQNNSSFSSQGRSKKKDRGDQGSEPIKRERFSKTDDGDSGYHRPESVIKAEIAKITDKGGLVNFEGVDKLVQLMQLDRGDKKIDLAGRVMVADVIAATDKFDCLERFVQLRGVPVLDDWLQEAHKGKVGDGKNPKENDKSTEDFLLTLLRALDKLPVNLHALQTSNVGKSVNNLRSHNNLEIHRKARSLVDTWKKRVDLEMKINDAKSPTSQSVSWPGKPGFSEISHGGGRRSGSAEVSIKSIITQPAASKTGSSKTNHLDNVAKSTATPPGSIKLAPSSPVLATAGSKDSHFKTVGGSGMPDMPLIREEKSSSSSQSQNNSQSCSSDHAKNACKEDARSSTAGSRKSNMSSGSSRTRKSSNGILGAGGTGAQTESILGKTGFLGRNTTSDKTPQAGLTCERSVDMPPSDLGNSHRLIVRLPNPGRSPVPTASGSSLEDHTAIGSRASSPGGSDKHDFHDRKVKGKSDSCRASIDAGANSDGFQNPDSNNGFVRSDDGNRPPAVVVEEEECTRDSADNSKQMDSVKTACSSGNENGTLWKSGNPFESSFSINALIESCVKYSEATSSLSAGDDVGMNLLASVATGEMPNSEPVSPCGSPEMNSPVREDIFSTKTAKLRSLHDDIAIGHGSQDDNFDSDPEKQGNCVSPLLVRDVPQNNSREIDNSAVLCSENKPANKRPEELPSSSMEFHQPADPCPKSDGELGRSDGFVGLTDNRTTSGEEKNEIPGVEGTEGSVSDVNGDKVGAATDLKEEMKRLQEDAEMVDFATEKVEKEAIEESSGLMGDEKMDVESEKLSGGTKMKQQYPAAPNHGETLFKRNPEPYAAEDVLCSVSPVKCEKADSTDMKWKVESGDVEMTERIIPEITNSVDGVENSEKKEVLGHRVSGNAPHEEQSTVPALETIECLKPAGSKLSGEVDETEECISTEEASSLSDVTGSDAAKLDFDLNEGFPADEGNPSDPVFISAPTCTSVQLPSPVLYQVSPLPSGLPASITVASAAKGPFVHPENLLKIKGELGWKGSAATSAFRPAEPRKILEMPLGNNDITNSDNSVGKQCRPPLDIDLNVPDDRVLEDLTSRIAVQDSGSGSASAINNCDLGHSMMFNSSSVHNSGGLDLDLNRADEGVESGQPSTSTSRRFEVPRLSVRSSSGEYLNGEVNILRDFDLNNGPGIDEVATENTPSNQLVKSSGLSTSQVGGFRVSNAELGGISSWFSPGTSYPAVAIPSFLPDRGSEQPYPFVATAGAQRMISSANGITFGGDLYRGPVLSSSPMPFPPAGPFPYAGYPFGNNFPLASTSFAGGSTTFMDSSSGGSPCFPAVPSQLVGPAGAVSSHYPRPYVISLPESTSSGAESNRKWSRQSLDLNAGPGSTDVGRDERLAPISGQFAVANPQSLAEEHTRIYQSASGPIKRKEPEGGWDSNDRFSYKQPSWQ